MLLNPPVITKELHNLKSLCERCCRNEINAYTPEGRKERELLIQEIQQECDIKYNTSKNRYTLIPRMSKEEIKQYKRTQQKTQQGKMVFIPEEQQYVDVADNQVFSNSGFDDLIIYYAYHGEYETKKQFIITLLHNLEFYKIYNKYSQELQKLLKQYPVSFIKDAEEFISESLYGTISDTLKRLDKTHKLDMDEYYLVKGKSVPAYEIAPIIKSICKEKNCHTEKQLKELLGDEYYNIRDTRLQALILNENENLHLLIKDDSIENIKDYTIDYKHIRFYCEAKYAVELTKEQQIIIFNRFIGRWRERLRYRIKNEFKKSTEKGRYAVYSNHAQEYFDVFESFLKLSSNGYHTPEEYVRRDLKWNYDININWKEALEATL